VAELLCIAETLGADPTELFSRFLSLARPETTSSKSSLQLPAPSNWAIKAAPGEQVLGNLEGALGKLILWVEFSSSFVGRCPNLFNQMAQSRLVSHVRKTDFSSCYRLHRRGRQGSR
jgi:hypothetical protein